MEARKKYWLGIASIVGLSIGITFFAPISEVYKGISILPSVGALAAALFQLVRDHSAHHRKHELQNEQHLFNLGATSHMANTVFDKHVEFCEKYLSEVHKTVTTLTVHGPTQTALTHSGNLYTLRIDYTAWITPEIDRKLVPFERAVREIGTKARLAEALKGESDPGGDRIKAVHEMYDIFRSLMDIGDTDVKDEDATFVAVKHKVREILQVNDLVAIREYLVFKAASMSARRMR
ncbi:MAG: hypothetical protein H6926_05450 [Chromatiales bacterium]|nr:hypothetical protein [Chromatiales bacterium]